MRLTSLVLIAASVIACCLPDSVEARSRRSYRNWGWGGGYSQPYYAPGWGGSYAAPMNSYSANYAAPAYDVGQSCQPSYSGTAPQPYAAGYGPQGGHGQHAAGYGQQQGGYGQQQGGYGPQDASSGPQAPNAVTVGAYDNYFEPKSINVQPGTTIQFVNYGKHPHTVTMVDGRWCSGDIQPGATYSATFRYAGTYSFYCRHHTADKMELTVIVGQDAPQPPQPQPPQTAEESQAAPRY